MLLQRRFQWERPQQKKRRLTHPNSKSFRVSEEFRKAEGFPKGSRRYIA